MQSYDFILTWFRTWESLASFRFRATSTEALKNSEWVTAWPWASTKNSCASTDVICKMTGGHLNGLLGVEVPKTVFKEGSMVASPQTELLSELAPLTIWFIARFTAGVRCCALPSALLSLTGLQSHNSHALGCWIFNTARGFVTNTGDALKSAIWF